MIKCRSCETDFSSDHSTRRYCDSCKQFALANRKKQKNLTRESIGKRSELKACIYFLEQGYEVFSSIRHFAPFDLVIWKDGKYQSVEVRTGHYGENGSLLLPNVRNKADILVGICDEKIVIRPAKYAHEDKGAA